jgi:hypothetical protein
VAREVTQPEWPSRVPRRTSCSAIVMDRKTVWRQLVCASAIEWFLLRTYNWNGFFGVIEAGG